MFAYDYFNDCDTGVGSFYESSKCFGLDVVRYDAHCLHDEPVAGIRLVESLKEMPQTAFGTMQRVLHCHCRVV